MSILAGIAIAGTVISAFGASKASKAQARAARAAARAKRAQAEELLRRAQFNKGVQQEQGRGLQASQIGAYAKSGVALSSNSTLAALQNTASTVSLGIQQMLDEADFKADQLRKGADVDTRLAGDIQTAGKYQVAGTLLSGAAKAASMTSGWSTKVDNSPGGSKKSMWES